MFSKFKPYTSIIVTILALIIAIWLLNVLSLQYTEAFFNYYTFYIYKPIQKLKALLWQDVVFNFGDLFYVVLFIIIIVAVIHLIIVGKKITKKPDLFFKSSFRFIRLVAVVYFLFLISWGINYNRPRLATMMDGKHYFTKPDNADSSSESKLLQLPIDTLLVFGASIIREMNEMESQVNLDTFSWNALNTHAQGLYNKLQDEYTVVSKIKKASLGNWLNAFGIQGYFNPITGEGQVIGDLPASLKPFVILHEMAHQAGIASEGDANLLAVLVSLTSENIGFQYAGLLNAYLYLKNELKYRDSLKVQELIKFESPRLKEELTMIQNYRRAYRSEFRFISMGAYDAFLKFFGQKQGIRSYGGVTRQFYLYRKEQLEMKKIFQHL